MSDDEFLRELARVAREEHARESVRLDQRWDRLAAGDLSADEEAELRRLAAASEEGSQAYEAFRPLGAEFQARVVSAIRAQPAEEGDEERSEVPPVEPFTPSRGRLLAQPPLASRRRSGLAAFTKWLGGGVAAAAGIVLSLWLRMPGPLPEFGQLEVQGDQTYRGGEVTTHVAVLHPGSTLKATIEPLAKLEGQIEVRWFLVGDQGRRPQVVEIKPIGSDQAQVKPEGVVELRGTVGTDPGDLHLPPGHWTLCVAIGRPGRLPPPDLLGSLLRSLHGTRRAPGGEWIIPLGRELEVEEKP